MRILTFAVLVTFTGSIAMAQQPAPQTDPTPATQTTATPNSSTTPQATSTPVATTPPVATQTPSAAPSASPAPDTVQTPGTAAADASVQASTDQDAKTPDAKTGDKKAADKKKDAAAKDAAAVPPAEPGEELDTHIKKGTEEDVDAVGQRNIGGRGMGNWYSTNWEIGTGKQYSMEIEKSSHLVTDPVVVEYVNRIGQNLVKNSDAKVPFTIKVLDTDEINAMALPGGYFYVNSGLILACDSEDELAGVMAHEIAHVAAHHAAREMTKLNYMQIGSIPLMIFAQGSWVGYGIYEASQLAIPLTFLQFSREYEAEADYLGIQYAYRAGYDPQGMVSIFEKLDALEKHKPGALSRAFSDHPATPDRIADVEQEIATILPARPDYLVTTSEFDQVKARLARIQNKRGIQDKKNGNKPTLRRVGGTNNDPNATPTTTSDQPTLGRRD
jgi:predicted Zn-dependent protease